MRDDPQFYLPDTDEGRAKYLAKAVQIVDEMKKRLDELFITKPKADIVVKAVEKFRESLSAGAAFYQQPAPDGSRPGMLLREPARHVVTNPGLPSSRLWRITNASAEDLVNRWIKSKQS